MRIMPALAAFVLLAAPATAEHHAKVTKVKTVPQDAPMTGHEIDIYRFGQPYNWMRGTTPGNCELMCNRDDSCAAWTLTPATFELGPRCELKRSVGSASFRPGAVSGLSQVFQPDPVRDGTMRYQPRPVPDLPQPAPRPVEQLRPRPLTPSANMNELLGGPTSITSGEASGIRPQPAPQAPQAARAPTTSVYRGPGEGQVPAYVKQPAPTTTPAASSTPAPAARSAQPSAMVRRPSAQPSQPVAPTTPDRPVPQFQMVPDTAPPPAARAPVATAPTGSAGGVQTDPPAPIPNARRPWTERTGAEPAYSVGGDTYVPGDEDATAGFLDGAPATDD